MIRAEDIAPAAEACAAPLNVADRFDADAVWATLAPEQRAVIGAAALDLVAARTCVAFARAERRPYHAALQRAGRAAMGLALQRLEEAFDDAVADDQVETADGQRRIPGRDRFCCGCACSPDDPCQDGFEPCLWVADDLCSHCAGPGMRPQ